MTHMRRIFTAILAATTLALLALPAIAPATLSEVGVIGATTPETVPSCPASPCLAVSRTTGFQVKIGSQTNILSAPRSGTIVAWTIILGKPNATQIKFFDANEGGPSTAGIAILRPQKKPNLTYKLISQSPLVKLEPYFGKTAQFPLETTLLARLPAQGELLQHLNADRPDDGRRERPVRLSVSHRPPDLQRD
jgi:hypothetical protein